MARQLKTTASDASVPDFLAGLADERQRREAQELDRIMRDVTGGAGRMYGTNIVGYGTSSITYADGRVEPWFAIGFAPRTGKFAIYGTGDVDERDALLAQLGRHSTGRSCLYVPKLEAVDRDVLTTLLRRAAAQ